MKRSAFKPFRKVLSLLLCVAMLAAFVPAPVFAQTAEECGAGSINQLSQTALDQIINLYPGGDMSTTLTYDCGNGLTFGSEKSYLTIVRNTDATAFESFKANLSYNGFKLRSENTIASQTADPNVFASYLSADGSYKLYTYYLSFYKETRIIVDTQEDTVEGYKYEPQAGVEVEPKLVMWGLPMSEIGYDSSEVMSDEQKNQRNCGNAYVIRMPDNSLFFHDGGDVRQWDDATCALFLDFCRELTGTTGTNEKMVINTWFISHAHRDHFLGFYRFLNIYHDQFDLKNVMYNIDNERVGYDYDITGAMKMVRTHFPDARYYKPHTGEVIDIAGVRVDVMYSIEDRYVPNAKGELITDDDNVGGTYRDYMYKDATKLTSNFNDTTVVLRTTFENGVDAILYADMALSTRMMMEAYHDDFIQADIVTVPHHGFDLRTELMTSTHPKVFLFPQRESAVYGPDGDVSTMDLYGTYHKNLRNNFLEMFPGMVVPKGTTPDVDYKMLWAGNNTVTIDINALGNTSDPAASDAYYTTQATPEVEYTGWGCTDLSSDPKDYSDRLISMSDPAAATTIDASSTWGFRFEPVKNATLTASGYYLIMHQKSGNIFAYDSLVHDPGRPNKGTSVVQVPHTSNSSKDYNVYSVWNGNYNYNYVYTDHSNLDKVAWILGQETKATGSKLVNLSKSVTPLFGGTAVYEKTWFAKGYMGHDDNIYTDNDGNQYVANWWRAVEGNDDASPITQYRFLNPRYPGNGWVSNKALSTHTDVNRSRYRIEYLGTDDNGIAEYLVYYIPAANTYQFLTCDAGGNWGVKDYATVAEAMADLDNLKLRLYSFKRISADKKDIYYSADATVFNVERGTNIEQLLDIFHDQGNLVVKNGTRRQYKGIRTSGTTVDVVGSYYFKFDKEYDPSAKSYSQYTVSVMYSENAAGDTKLLDLTVNLYDRDVQFTGTAKYEVTEGTSEEALRALIADSIQVKTVFSNAGGALADAPVAAYSAAPEAGNYWLDFDTSANGDSYVDVNYRRTDGSDILVKTLYVYTKEQIDSFAVDNKHGLVMVNSGLGGVLKDANGADLTVMINGTARNVSVGMLTKNGNPVDTSVVGTYEGLTLTYAGEVLCNDFTMEVTENDPGYVAVNQVGTTTQEEFNQSGVANIQLSVSGIPADKGVDLIMVMDLSGSMMNTLDSNSNAANYRDSRIYAMENSLKEMVRSLQASGTDVRIAMSDFGDLDHFELDGAVVDSSIAGKPVFDLDFNNSKYASSFEFANHLNYVFTNETGTGITHNPYGIHGSKFDQAVLGYTGGVRPTVYTGSGKVSADAFVDVDTLYDGVNFTTSMNRIIDKLDDNVREAIGTNYDVGLEYAYHLGYAIQQDNIAKGADREIICVFMSDGGPMQFNYFSGTTTSSAWVDWITGEIESLGSAGYSKDNLPEGLQEIHDLLLTKFKNGKLTRPEYRRGPWNHLLYQQNSDGTYSSTGTSINVASNGYFIYRDRYHKDTFTNFYEYMDAMGYDLDWDYLCRIAYENGIENFDAHYYENYPLLTNLISLFRDKEFIGYENAGGGVYRKVYRTKLINPSVTITQHYKKSDYAGDDFFEAMRSIGIDCTWDLFAKIALKNVDSDITKGKEIMTAFNSVLRTVPEGYTHGTLSPYAHFYNEEGKNWWAEAIKGDPNKLYSVVNKYAYTDSPYAYNGDVTQDYEGKTYMSGFRGLGIDMYSVSFSMMDDNLIRKSDMVQIMQKISSGGEHFFAPNSQAELTDALNAIVADIASGDTGASCMNTLGEQFDLYYGQVEGVDVAPVIKVVQGSMVLETITFGNPGEAYSDQISGNIWQENGLIQGKYVTYNTNSDAVDTLPGETFLWNIGEVGQNDMVLEYQVYLTGSMEGTLKTDGEIKSYPTSKRVTLNGLGNVCTQEAESPVYTWQTAATIPTISLEYPTLLLEDEIKMNVYFTIDQDIDMSKMGMLTWTSQPDVVDISTADAVIPGATYNADLGFYGVTTEGIPAQNLGDVVYFCIYVELADGTIVYGKQVSYSPTTYAYNQLNGDADAETKALYVAILNYGAAAQEFLKDTDPLVNANLTAQQKALVEEYRADMVHSVAMPGADKQGALAANGGFTKLSPTISLDSAFAINYYFTPGKVVKGDMTFYYWNAADFAAADVLNIDNATGSAVMVNENGVYGAAIEGIAAKDIDSALYACGVYTDADGNTYSTGVLPYSLGFYCGNQAAGTGDTADLAAAIAVYGYYASSYFAAK